MKRSAQVTALLGILFSGSVAAAADPYEATRARPLFSPTRRPPPPAVAPASLGASSSPQPPAPPPELALSGVILGPGVAVALLTRPGGGEAARVALGGLIDGWRVSEIQRRSVILTLADRSVTIALPDAIH